MASNTEAITWNDINQANYVGIRPGYYGLQVTAYGVSSNNVVVIYTVPADKILLIFTSYLSGNAAPATWLNGYLSLRNAVPANVHVIHNISAYNNGVANPGPVSRFSPLACPSLYSIVVESTGVACSATGGFEGILVDA